MRSIQASKKAYSVTNLVEELDNTLQTYLEAQYHIWDESLIRERKAFLEKPGTISQIPLLEATPHYAYGKAFSDLDIPRPAKDILTKISKYDVGLYPSPYQHQAEALESFLTDDKNIIIATGTGSGKTESFLMPLISSLAIEASDKNQTPQISGMRALVLYPMNALVNDQMSRLRKIVGDKRVAELLKANRGRNVTFGMYTGRTAYSGKKDSEKDRKILKKMINELSGNNSLKYKEILEKEGKWPAKDMESFVKNGYITHENDRELFSRHEMQAKCPDILVTNYSMLEYMLIRPIESPIFDQTKEWLESDPTNKLIVVIDEAHMYRGAAGAEVGLLLRRFQSRLGVERNRIKYILTSASLGSTEEAKLKVKEFAADLTGLTDQKQEFHLITGKVEDRKNPAPAINKDIIALENFPYSILHEVDINLDEAVDALRKFIGAVSSYRLPAISSQNDLRIAINDFLEQYPPACELSNYITSNPHSLNDIRNKVFPNNKSNRALEALMALCSYGQKNDGRVYLPTRLHTFYRGISGIYACINPDCSYKNDKSKDSALGLLGQFFDFPRRSCECGCRVYELLTHRDCGAAFIKVYLRDMNADFAWHESNSLNRDNSLLEAHFLVEAKRNRGECGSQIWLHKKTGKISYTTPNSLNDYLNLVRPDTLSEDYNPKNIFINECPVCLHKWSGNNIKIMDLATKGEAPFAHLITAQLRLQPPKAGNQYSNQGRKNLIFSDGRQKAARLARDIPREIQQDVFRQLLLYSVNKLKTDYKGEAILTLIYTAFLCSLKEFNLILFDGPDSAQIADDLNRINKEDYDDFRQILEEFRERGPEAFYQELLRQLGNTFYSVQALTLAYVLPTDRAMKQLQERLPDLDQESIKNLSILWIQTFLNNMALDKKISSGARTRAKGFPNKNWGVSAGFDGAKKKIINKLYGDAETIEQKFKEVMATDENGAYFLQDNKIKIEIAVHDNWYQCQKCTHISPIHLKSHCMKCGSQAIVELNPNSSDYLRARKKFWRDPVVNILENKAKPISLNVCEHTAQLSYRDQDEIKSTTEDFERLFKDVILNKGEEPIDILSCTTTMEVGIDIGSLIAVGLRNIPPQRQNYQQRVGRAGRRGAAISTIITYAQNSPHDHYYFKNVKQIISGEPPIPSIDITNERLIIRHIHATVIQYFFHNGVPRTGRHGVFDAMGKTWSFFNDVEGFSFKQFRKWLSSDEDAKKLIKFINSWIPARADIDVSNVINNFILLLDEIRPEAEEEVPLESKDIISFLFNSGLLPSYAFPKDLCSIQIERWAKEGNYDRVEIIERAQQGLNVALSEYAPGKLLVINKLTYRIACITANKLHTDVDRAESLFAKAKTYNHCHDCFYTLPTKSASGNLRVNCPICSSSNFDSLTVIQPEMVFPKDTKPIDELDDEQTFTSATNAQLPVAQDENFEWQELNDTLKYSFADNQSLVMLNKGESLMDEEYLGFDVCNLCGHAVMGGTPTSSPHDRHYLIEGLRTPRKCHGTYTNVSLGYTFRSDILLIRISLKKPLDINLEDTVSRKALEDGLLTLCESISAASCHVLDIDARELKSGYRLTNIKGNLYADIFLYDSISGGAGYASMAGKKILEILDDAQSTLVTCNCLSSCHKCLRHYGNKHNHSSLDRKLALILLNYARYESPAEIKSIQAQYKELAALKDIFELDGWSLIDNADIPLFMKKNNKVLKYASSPSLFDPQEINHPLLNECTIVSTYRLNNDITGIFMEAS